MLPVCTVQALQIGSTQSTIVISSFQCVTAHLDYCLFSLGLHCIFFESRNAEFFSFIFSCLNIFHACLYQISNEIFWTILFNCTPSDSCLNAIMYWSHACVIFIEMAHIFIIHRICHFVDHGPCKWMINDYYKCYFRFIKFWILIWWIAEQFKVATGSTMDIIQLVWCVRWWRLWWWWYVCDFVRWPERALQAARN